MFCITLESDNPFFNLAVEELLFGNTGKEYLILYINRPSVIIGKHQSAHREVNSKYIFEKGIPVIRRISGGGTVFHDLGNLNFAFIRQSEEGKQVDFRRYTLPVIEFLSSIGVDAKFEGKNDIKAAGLKISGNAEHVNRNRVLHHGTLLFRTSLDMLGNALRKDTSCYTSKSVQSNPSSVTNISAILKRFRDIYEFRSEMMDFFLKRMSDTESYELSSIELKEAELLSSSRYMTWEWNYAYGPEYTFTNSFQLNGKKHSCRLLVREGIIIGCEIEGSYEMVVAGKKLTGCRHMIDNMSEVFKKENISITDGEIFNFF
jgi:lipoate---protein ligase